MRELTEHIVMAHLEYFRRENENSIEVDLCNDWLTMDNELFHLRNNIKEAMDEIEKRVTEDGVGYDFINILRSHGLMETYYDNS